ncbi:stimulator of interferon genes protein-like [Rhynchophorus ferrugineus]|uniref:stimulator of interferon genes protein-like n=1 Tax=Rhynchophorus ferrugineus TaxID=354439 RepID=UPI003FCCB459
MNNISEFQNVKKICVIKRGNRCYYPKGIPQEKEPLSIPFLCCIAGALVVHIFLTSDKLSLCSLYMFSLFYYSCFNFIYRIILFCYEKQDLYSKYKDNYFELLKAAFYFNKSFTVTFILCILYCVYYVCSYQNIPSLQDKYYIIVVFILYIIHKLLDIDANPITESMWISKSNGLNCGSGMAYSFFYGYLNLILPSTGDVMKNLIEMMQDYESANDIKFEFYKIFMLIPKSLVCHNKINEVSKIMELRSSLADKIKTIAGVRDRVYKNSVYSIKHEATGKLVYVCAEYATPINTFKEICRNQTIHTESYIRHKSDVVSQFFLTLSKILEHEKMDKMCELIYYDDIDENNKYYDVGKIILSRIVELKKYQESGN